MTATRPASRRSRPGMALGLEACERRTVLSGSGLLPAYDPGTPDVVDIWVDPVSGHDALDGTTRHDAVRSLSEAWRRVPVGTLSRGVRINLVAGTYPQAAVPGFWEGRHGSHAAPVIIRAADGPGTARLPSLNVFDCRHLHLVGLEITAGGGDVVQIQASSHVLLRDTTIRGVGDIASYAVPQEGLKVNQSQHIFVENCDISGAWDNAVDFVAVQHGHVVGSRIHRAGDWAMYAKGGSAYLTITGNEFFDAGTGGFTAGQGTGFEFMVAPWLHYEAYDIAFTNNVVRDVQGAGMGVNGGFNILLAHNTLVNVGTRSHVIEVVHGLRSCDGDAATCAANLALGGWGTAIVGREESIPNRNVVIVNNVVFNPDGVTSRWQHFAVAAERTPPPDSNIPSPARADDGLVMQGNVIWNGPSDHDLGIADAALAAAVWAQNHVNTVRPVFVDQAAGDYRLDPTFTAPAAAPVPAFTWAGAPAAPAVPAGRSDMSVAFDHTGAARTGPQVAGAFVVPGADLVIDVVAGQTATMAGPVAGTTRIVKRGPGLLVVDQANGHTGGTVVEAGAVVVRNVAALGSGSVEVKAGATVTLDVGSVNWNGGANFVTLTRLVLDPAARFEIGTGQIRVPAGGYDAATIRSRLIAGRNGGAWNGAAGFTSSAAGSGSSRAIGSRVMPIDNELRLGFAAHGDANLDGQVNVTDISLINDGALFGQGASSGAAWSRGDFDYSGAVSITDISLLNGAQVFGIGPYLPAEPRALSGQSSTTSTDGLSPWDPWVAQALTTESPPKRRKA